MNFYNKVKENENHVLLQIKEILIIIYNSNINKEIYLQIKIHINIKEIIIIINSNIKLSHK